MEGSDAQRVDREEGQGGGGRSRVVRSGCPFDERRHRRPGDVRTIGEGCERAVGTACGGESVGQVARVEQPFDGAEDGVSAAREAARDAVVRVFLEPEEDDDLACAGPVEGPAQAPSLRVREGDVPVLEAVVQGLRPPAVLGVEGF